MAPALTTEKTSENNPSTESKPSFEAPQVGRGTRLTRRLFRTLSQNNSEVNIAPENQGETPKIYNKLVSIPTEPIHYSAPTLAELCLKEKGLNQLQSSPEKAKMNTNDGSTSSKKQDREGAKDKSNQNLASMGVKANTATVAKVNKGSSNGTNRLLHVSNLQKPSTSKLLYEPVASCSESKVEVKEVLPRNVVTRSMTKSKEQIEKEVASRQRQLDSRADRLLRRLRRLQSRQAISHAKLQLGGLVDHQRNKNGTKSNEDESLDLKEVKNMSTAALVNYVHVWQAQKPPSTSKSSRDKKPDEHVSMKLDDDFCTDLDQVAGHLGMNLHHLENALDSDATESSSGGESCDEADYDYDWVEKVKLPLCRRTDWNWAKERAQIASRWTWLQAQVSDLEYRIRQQNEIYKQIRQAKGEVSLGDHIPQLSVEALLQGRKLPKDVEDKLLSLKHKNEMSPANVSSLLANLDKQSLSMNKQLGVPMSQSPMESPVISESGILSGKLPSTPNGLVGSSSHCSSVGTPQSSNSEISLDSNVALESNELGFHDYTCQAARCRPMRTESYRKRKLLRTSGLHLYNKKAARLSNVKCQCYPPATPCAMCGGRYNNTMGCENELSPVPERIALLDHSYHQVLSFEEDVPLSIHFEGLLKTGAWQHRSHSRSSRSYDPDKSHYQNKDKRRYKKLPPKSASAAVLSRIRNKYEVTRVLSALPASPDKKRLSAADIRLKKKKATLQAIDNLKKKDKRCASRSATRSYSESATGHHRGTPSPNPGYSMSRDIREVMRRKRAESAYDINNIVIPYSIAASTRVEKLQYKEIITPRWREVNFPKKSDGGQKAAKEVKKESTQVTQPASAPKPVTKKEEFVVEKESVEETKASTVIENPGENKELPKSPSPTSSKVKVCVQDSDEEEDLSDEAYQLRHHRCELEEKKKFSFYTTAQRRASRSHRADSETVLVEAMSPCTSASLLPASGGSSTADLIIKGEGVNHSLDAASLGVHSSYVTPPNTPAVHHGGSIRGTGSEDTEFLDIHGQKRSLTPSIEAGGGGSLRMRTCSVSSNISTASRPGRTLSMSLSTDDNVICWPKRTFPLNETENGDLFKERPLHEKYPMRHYSARAVHVDGESGARMGYNLYDDNTPSASPPRSPGSGSSTSTVIEDEEMEDNDDPDDPEWTVHKVNNNRKPGIVLKISKR